ncbi:MAG TPA: zinc-dependent metalloprotease [Candidatus Nanopelagicales bacterium]|jgi:putative hydrolase|nr:zinc-dependent metalloprotease [Candidatus Nanopelagicales bacterium]
MSPDQPFGFGAGGEFDPAKMDMSQLGEALQQLGRMLSEGQGSGEDGPVNWKLAHDTARSAISTAGDPSVGDAQRRGVEAAVSLAQGWLDDATEFPGTPGALAWSRSEWVEATLPAWRRVIEPVAGHVQEATGSLLPGTDGGVPELPEGLPPELAAMAGPMMSQFAGMAKSMSATMFGGQVGQGLATLAAEVVGAGDIGIPLTAGFTPALLPRNVRELGEGLGLPADQVQLYLALREAAQQRLFAHVGWLRPRLLEAVESYARGIHVDQDRIEQAARSIDPSDPEAIQNLLSSGVFVPEDSEAQRAALARLETLLALVEGWVDDVVTTAAAGRLPGAAALRETIQRRRASGGPAEKLFATLVGLELRPRRLREAARLWSALREERGPDGRDALWGHPDLLPNAGDLDDVDAFVARSAPLDLSALDELPPPPEPDAE